MNCLVTGGAGFIGSNLVNFLISEGHKVEVWDNFSTGKIENINKKAFVKVVNISKFDHVDTSYHNQKIDVIFHLAAIPRIQQSLIEPIKTSESNVLGTHNMLEIARKSGAKFIYAGSSSFYFDPLENPYAFTKWIGEEYCKMYHKIWGVPIAITRFFNVYGANHDRYSEYATVVASFEKSKIEKLPFIIFGDGSKRRDFTHVNDIVRGMIAASKNEWKCDIFNLGRAKNYSIEELAEMFDPDEVIYKPNRMGEAQDTLADIKETCNKLQWSPVIELEFYVLNFIKNLEKGKL